MYDQGKPLDEVRETATENESVKDKLLRQLTQKNVILSIIVLFIIWVAFFDRNSILHRFQLKQEQAKLIEVKREYQRKISDANKEIEALDDDEYIERIAREKHLMKKDNEDIYMVNE